MPDVSPGPRDHLITRALESADSQAQQVNELLSLVNRGDVSAEAAAIAASIALMEDRALRSAVSQLTAA